MEANFCSHTWASRIDDLNPITRSQESIGNFGLLGYVWTLKGKNIKELTEVSFPLEDGETGSRIIYRLEAHIEPLVHPLNSCGRLTPQEGKQK